MWYLSDPCNDKWIICKLSHFWNINLCLHFFGLKGTVASFTLLSPNLWTNELGRMPKILNKDSRLFTAQYFDLLYSDDDFDDNKISCYLIKDKLQGAPQDLFLLWDGRELGNCQNTGFNLEANFYKKHPIYVSQFQLSSDCQGKNNLCIMGL